MFLSEVSVKRPVFALMLNLVLIVFGVISYSSIGVDLFPNVDFPFVGVTVIYPGADPTTVEEKVLEPTEEALKALSGLKKLQATAYPNAAQFIMEFNLDTNVDVAAQDVRDKINAIQAALPGDIQPPVIGKFDPRAQPIMNLSLSSDTMSVGELSELADSRVKPLLQQVPGVANVTIVGFRDREVQVLLDREQLVRNGISVSQIAQDVQMQTRDVPGGKVIGDAQESRVRTVSTPRSVEEIANLMINTPSGQSIRLADLGTVQDTLEDEETYAVDNGRLALVLTVVKQSDANTVATAHAVQKRISGLSEVLPAGVGTRIVTNNATFIESSLNSVKFDLVLGALLAIVIVLVFLHDWRATIISALAIPTAVIASIGFMHAMDFTLNVITTLALTLSIGILVDDAIVVIENIHRRLKMGESPMDAARNGTSEIGMAVLAITLSIVCVFIPVAFMEGLIGRFFYQFGLTVAFSVMISLFVAFTLTPMLSSRFLKNDHGPKARIFLPLERILTATEKNYHSLIERVLHWRWATVGVGIIVLILSVFLLRFVPTTFMTDDDRSLVQVTWDLPVGTPLEVSKTRSAGLGTDLKKYPGVKDVLMTIGNNVEKSPSSVKYSVSLVPMSERRFSQQELIERMRTDLTPLYEVDGASLSVGGGSSMGGGRTEAIQFGLQGQDYAALIAFSNEMVEFIKDNVPEAEAARALIPESVVEWRVNVDPIRAAQRGLNAAQVGMELRTLFEGTKAGELQSAATGARYDIRVRIRNEDRSSVSDLNSVSLTNRMGQSVPLSAVASIEAVETPVRIEREGGERRIQVVAQYSGQDLGGVMKKIQTHGQKIAPANARFVLQGQAEILQETVGSVLKAISLAILLVFMVLCAQFESFLIPLVIMVSVPLSFSGSFLGLLATQSSLSMFAMIGLILLMGLVTKNAILLVDFAMQRIKQGMDLSQAIAEAGSIRLRPILMTTFAMIFGMLPIAIGHGEGGAGRAPMAIAVIGGLISSTLLTLVVVPCVLHLLQSQVQKRAARKRI